MALIRVALQFTTSLNEVPVTFDFGDKGTERARVFARVRRWKGLAALSAVPATT